MRKPAEIDSDDDGPVIARAAAIDVAKATGMVRARVPHAGKPDRKVTKVWEVDATTAAIIELAGHLTGLGIERVVLEATGDYWRCWHYLLSAAELECWLVNARDVKNVPGRPKRQAGRGVAVQAEREEHGAAQLRARRADAPGPGLDP